MRVSIHAVERALKERRYQLSLEIDGSQECFEVAISGERLTTVRAEDRFWRRLAEAPDLASRALEEVLRFHRSGELELPLELSGDRG